MESDGEVYPCDFYVLDRYKLGNLNECGFQEINQRREELRFIEESYKIDEKCKSCKYFQICKGGCKHYRETFTGIYQLNYFCEAYYDFFDHAYPKMLEISKEIFVKIFLNSKNLVKNQIIQHDESIYNQYNKVYRNQPRQIYQNSPIRVQVSARKCSEAANTPFSGDIFNVIYQFFLTLFNVIVKPSLNS